MRRLAAGPHFPSQPLQLEREERRRGTCAEPRSRTWGAQCEEAEVSSICKARSCPGPAQQPVCLFLCLHREAAVGGPPRGSLASPRHRGQGPLLFTRPVGTCHTRGPASASAREPAGRAQRGARGQTGPLRKVRGPQHPEEKTSSSALEDAPQTFLGGNRLEQTSLEKHTSAPNLRVKRARDRGCHWGCRARFHSRPSHGKNVRPDSSRNCDMFRTVNWKRAVSGKPPGNTERGP